jgi:thioredoxin reductase (NADPH)
MPYDVIIIGAGPAGLTAGIYARTRKLNTLIIEASEAGGQLASLYPDKGVENYPGMADTGAGFLAKSLVDHSKSMGCEIREFPVFWSS